MRIVFVLYIESYQQERSQQQEHIVVHGIPHPKPKPMVVNDHIGFGVDR